MSELERRTLDWWENVYLPTLTPEEREAELASRGWAWRIMAPRVAAAIKRTEDLDILRGSPTEEQP